MGQAKRVRPKGSIRVWSTCEPEGLSTPLWCGQAGCPHGEQAPATQYLVGRGHDKEKIESPSLPLTNFKTSTTIATVLAALRPYGLSKPHLEGTPVLPRSSPTPLG